MTYSIRKNIVDLFRGGFFALPLKLVLFNCLIIFIAFVSAKYIPESFDESKYWFQRSGAIVTLVTIWVEVKLVDIIAKRSIFNEIFGLKQSINNHLPNYHTITIDENEMRDTTKEDITHFKAQTKNRANFFNAIIFINLITGTVIWAYGDLIYISFFNNYI